jgi:uncharacterized membrane protein HdeD (DUF308 family)
MATADSSARPRLTTILAIRGALAIVLGLATAGLFVLAVMFPRVTADVLVLLFGIYVLLDGLTALIDTPRSSATYAWWLRLQGLLGLCVGIGIISQRGSIGTPLFYLVIGWAILTGALDLLVASQIRAGEAGILRLAGVASIVLGVVILSAWPGGGLVPFVWLLAAYALIVGILRVTAALRLPSLSGTRRSTPTSVT